MGKMVTLKTLLGKVRAAGCRREYCFLPLGSQDELSAMLAAQAELAATVRAACAPPTLQAGKRARH